MNRIVKRAAIGFGTLLVVVLLIAASAFFVGNSRLHATHDGVGHDLTLPTDSASIATGERLTCAYDCRDCHGAALTDDEIRVFLQSLDPVEADRRSE